jgi:hypothetical protein
MREATVGILEQPPADMYEIWPVLHLQNIFFFLISDALLNQKSPITALVRFYTSVVSGNGDL